MQAQYSDIEALVERVKEVRLKDLLKQGIGYLHEAMHPADQEILHTLFQSGAIQVHLCQCSHCQFFFSLAFFCNPCPLRSSAAPAPFTCNIVG